MRELQEVASSLRDGLDFLTRFGLSPQRDEISHSKLLGDRLLITYSSPRDERGVRVYFAAERPNMPARFTVFLDAGGGRSVFLDEYLANSGRKKLLALFRNSEPKKSIADFSAGFAKFLQVILENSFSSFLKGETADIPAFDWSPYK